MIDWAVPLQVGQESEYGLVFRKWEHDDGQWAVATVSILRNGLVVIQSETGTGDVRASFDLVALAGDERAQVIGVLQRAMDRDPGAAGEPADA